MSVANARRDIIKILNGGFSIDITLKSPSLGSLPIALKVVHTNHFNKTNDEGLQVNARSTSISIAENDLILANYNYKARGKIYLTNHIVELQNANGTTEHFVIVDTKPNYGLGIITCILSSYDPIN